MIFIIMMITKKNDDADEKDNKKTVEVVNPLKHVANNKDKNQ